ncbi:MAG: glutamine synthetase type III, partial [Clostridia bacterium]|nr:glutamine synthetase type III [Clostridia bacterium]
SGKHNNWSLATDTGVNLLSPGDTPYQNARFLLFLCAVIQAVDDYQDLLRLSVATAGNDHRLGANEAPPAVLSIFLGEELSAILSAIEKDVPYHGGPKKILKLGVDTLPDFARDNTDRNRTSPFAFTGNKFEFRMVGSSDSISCANIMLNTAVAESLRQYADRLEGAADFEGALHALIQEVIKGHKRILFDGNGYDEAWIKEAEKRGLCNYPTTPDCMPHLTDAKNAALFERHKVYTAKELQSRCEIMLDNYCKTVTIEANTMLDMVRKQILPAVSEYVGKVSATGLAKKGLDTCVSTRYEEQVMRILSNAEDKMVDVAYALGNALASAQIAGDVHAESRIIRDDVLPLMGQLREAADQAEGMVDNKAWPFPSYCDLLFGVR